MTEPQTFKYMYEESGYCRVYYRGSKGGVYCLQWEGGDIHVFYTCTDEAEPETPFAKIPAQSRFDRYVEPSR